MRMTARWLAALLCAGFSTSFAHAQFYGYPTGPCPMYQPAPDACGPGYYVFCPDGTYLGPNYCLRPPFEPFNGMRPQNQPGAKTPGPPMSYLPGQYVPPAMGMAPAPIPGGPKLPSIPGIGQPAQPPKVAFPTHPYARSPRDFFMWSEAQQDLLTRQQRPAFIP